jgi:hypothetical protein
MMSLDPAELVGQYTTSIVLVVNLVGSGGAGPSHMLG